MSKLTIDLVAGARPNFMKIAPLYRELAAHASVFTPRLVHTGQHYDNLLSDIFFSEFSLPAPDIHLGSGGSSPAEQTARIMHAYDQVLKDSPPGMTLVVGDVNSTIGCGLAAAHRGVPLVHLEAGLRSFDRTMPEEINRVLTDALADLLLTPSSDADLNLKREGIADERIRLVGNIMIDTLEHLLPRADTSDVLSRLGLEPQRYALVTLHRAGNVDDPGKLARLLAVLAELSQRMPVVLPAHPRLRKNIDTLPEDVRGCIAGAESFKLIDPLGYIDFLALEQNARLVLTDSGGVQEETTVLGVPCLTLRENTERPVTVTHGTNRVVGCRPDDISQAFEDTLALPMPGPKRPPLWDGHTAGRVVEELRILISPRERGMNHRREPAPKAFVIPSCHAHRSPDVRRELLLVAETGDWRTAPEAAEVAQTVRAYAGGPHVILCADIVGGLAALVAETGGGAAVLGGWIPHDVVGSFNGSVSEWPALLSGPDARSRMVYVPPVLPPQWLAPNVDEIIAWAEAHPDVTVAVDERWYEYEQDTVITGLSKAPNLVALRSLGPGFGLEGLDVGYLVTASGKFSALFEDAMHSALLPFVRRAAQAALLDQGYMREYTKTRLCTRLWLARELKALGHHVTELSGPILFVEGAIPAILTCHDCVSAVDDGWLWAVGTPEQVEDIAAGLRSEVVVDPA
jgi:UDP-N-acetylglucosamine 2-epimerase (non-hydrolysing)